jgi:transposase-like protein
VSKNRDQAAAVRFFKKAAIGNNEAPEKITPDGSGASHQAVAELKAEGILPAQTLHTLDVFARLAPPAVHQFINSQNSLAKLQLQN